MNGVVGLVAGGIISSKSLQYYLIYDDLRQVQVGVDGSNLFQAVIEPVTIINNARIKVRLRGLELHHNISFCFLHLLTKSSQLHH